ncbi:MAG: acyltransferase family protein [Pseudomonadales bacterium]|nr:acyltransferase family protein [Pseudomonadales bacterium]
MSNSPQSGRAAWADNCKFLAILLIFFCHFLETLYDQGATSIFLVIKFCHSFFIPVFFILVGVFSHSHAISLKASLNRLLPRRIIPMLFFQRYLYPRIY